MYPTRSQTRVARLTFTKLHLTPKEAQRLRKVSYQRQLEAGMKNPGSAGLTSDRLGDADQWALDEKLRSNSQSPSTSEPLNITTTQDLK
jgi:hypothetical protein